MNNQCITSRMKYNTKKVQTTLKEDAHQILADIAYTEDNHLSKQLRKVCDFYVEKNGLVLRHKPNKNKEEIQSN